MSSKITWRESDPVRDREWNAYTNLHQELKKRYLGKYVAIYHGARRQAVISTSRRGEISPSGRCLQRDSERSEE